MARTRPAELTPHLVWPLECCDQPGLPLWHFNTGQAITASTVTYSFKGRQYVAVEAGLDAVT